MTTGKISVCIATHRRPERLFAVLRDLAAQERLPDEIIVVDNDAQASARVIVEQARQEATACPIHYDVQPIKNIALTRNRTVELATGEWLAFIDDDERAPATWLKHLADAVTNYRADCALGPVVPVVGYNAPAWIRRGRFYDWPRMPSGDDVPANRLRFGNLLLRASLVRMPSPFDPAYGLTGGEDGDLLARLAAAGARIVWCDEAIVREPVEAARLSLRWLLRRSLRGGQDFARHTLAGRYGAVTLARRSVFLLRACFQLSAAAALSAATLPLGKHRAAHWLLKAAANAGKISVFWGFHYREYAATPPHRAASDAGASA